MSQPLPSLEAPPHLPSTQCSQHVVCRKRLPHDAIHAAVLLTQHVPQPALLGMLQLCSPHDEPALVMLLRLELLWDRLPPKQRKPLHVLPQLLQHAG